MTGFLTAMHAMTPIFGVTTVIYGVSLLIVLVWYYIDARNAR